MENDGQLYLIKDIFCAGLHIFVDNVLIKFRFAFL